MMENRIVNNGDLVEIDIVLIGTKTERSSVGNKMYGMSGGGEGQAQLGGHNPGAAVGRKAGNADTHGISSTGLPGR